MIKHSPLIINLSDWPDLIFFQVNWAQGKIGRAGRRKNGKCKKFAVLSHSEFKLIADTL